jgi:hypothetical protein
MDRDPEKVFIERGEGRETHYFYWKTDLYKPFDCEPVTLLDGLLCTRWRGLALWTDPVARGKPLMTFALGVHTPLAYSRSWLVWVAYCLRDLAPVERFWLGFYLSIFNALLQGVLKLPREEEFHGYMDKAVEGEVPERYRLKPSEWAFLTVVGPFPEKLPREVRERLRECGEKS